jgi:amino acid adenylation domain-containing protein
MNGRLSGLGENSDAETGPHPPALSGDHICLSQLGQRLVHANGYPQGNHSPNSMQPLTPSNSFEQFVKSDIHQGIHQRFANQVKKYGKRVAIKDPDRTLTYDAVDNEANNIAHSIVRKTGGITGQVAFLLQNDSRAVTTLLGILKAGMAYVPLDPLFPKDRTTFMLDHSESRLIITNHVHQGLAEEISGGRIPMLLVDEVDLTAARDYTRCRTDPGSMAYILYTSGSTGKPKGIAFSHRNLLHTTMCLINKLHICEDDRLTQLHSTSFAASVVDIYCPLLNGASVYPWDVKARGIGRLANWLIEERVTSIQWIPTPFRQLMATLREKMQFPDVRLLILASEPLTRREYDLYRQHFPDSSLLVNQMGTSESYNYYLFFANKETAFEGSSVPAGFPVSEDREVVLLDENRNEVAPGEIGEIAIKSEYMSLGYWRNPELTKEKFLSDSSNCERLIYFTGDLGQRIEGGCLMHLGRKDFQLKIRGYRIELPEIEYAIKQLDRVQDVAAMARPDPDDELRLVAYYITDDGHDLSVTKLRRALSEKLPDYMIPHAFVRMAAFPMTPSGKVDKNSLPMPDGARPVLDNVLVPAKTVVEKTLVEIWREVLGREEVGVTDEFFELGGDSLKAAQVLYLAGVRCGVELGYSELIRAPRIADLATRIEYARLESQVGQVAAIDDARPHAWKEGILRGAANRMLQVLALYAPGLKSLRVWLHRFRGVRIGKNVAIGTAAIIETARPELVWIGDDVAIGIRNVIIGHFSDSIIRDRMAVGPTVRICNGVYLGPNVTILPNVVIGEGSVVTAGSVVNKSVAPGTMVQGNPAVAVAHCGVPLVGKGRTYEEFLRHLRVISS